jgi:tetratricopeptide (TPR) repeat protein
MRSLVAISAFLLSTSVSLAEVSQDCRAADPAKAIGGCTVFLQNTKASKGDQAFAYILRADAFIAQGQLDAAAKDLEKAFQIVPNSASGLTVRGRLHFRRADYRKALADLDAAVRQTPNSVAARRLRGIVQMELTNYAEAKKELDWVIANSPTDSTAFANRGRLHRLQNNNDLALADLDRAVALAPRWTWALLQRADTYQLKGDYQRAVADYDRVLAITPNDTAAQQRRTAALALLKPGGGAPPAPSQPRPPGNVASPSSPSAPAPQPPAAAASNTPQALQQARSMLERGDAPGAYRIANELLKADPNLADAYLLRGRAFYHERMYTQAIEDLNKYVGLKPGDATGYYIRGLVRADVGRSDEAIADADQIQRLVPTDTRSHNLRGWTHYVAGRHAQADQEFSAAIRMRASDLLYVNRALARMELGQYGEAEADLKDAYALNARSARTLATRGQLEVRTGRIEQGEASFRDALAIDPNYISARIGQQALFTARALKQLPASSPPQSK